MEANYVHKDSTTLVQDELVKNELNQIELQYNALKQQKFNELLKENQELKQKYLNAVSDYETTMAEKNELKKQLKEYKRLGFKHLNDKCNKLENQQKEFIYYLEDESKEIYRDGGLRQNIFRQILQRYKSIIGDINDKK